MSLNQAFLKLYGNDDLTESRTEHVHGTNRCPDSQNPHEEGIRGMNISFRVDQPQVPPYSQVASSPASEGVSNIFSIEKERRRRNPSPEPGSYRAAEQRERETSSAVARNLEEGKNDEFPTCTVNRPSEPSADRRQRPEVISFARERELRAREELSRCRESSFSTERPVSIAAIPSYRMGQWPAHCRDIFERGKVEFAELADAVGSAVFKGNRILGFGGWGNGTGVSTLVLGILDEMLRRRRKVLLIDADFQRPQLAEILGIPVESGWENLPRYPESISDCGLVRVDAEQAPFWFLPLLARGVPEAVAVSCKKRWFHSLLELAERFDLILIDHGSLRTGNDREKVFELLRFGCDGYFIVNDTRSPLGANASRLPAVSDECRLPCLGIIENFT